MKNRIQKIVIAGALSFATIPLMAHGGGHTHEKQMEQSSKKEIEEASKEYIYKLIQDKKIESNWKNSTLIEVKQQKINGRLEWIVQYKNTAIEDSTKQMLFVFIDLYGTVKAANHTGK